MSGPESGHEAEDPAAHSRATEVAVAKPRPGRSRRHPYVSR